MRDIAHLCAATASWWARAGWYPPVGFDAPRRCLEVMGMFCDRCWCEVDAQDVCFLWAPSGRSATRMRLCGACWAGWREGRILQGAFEEAPVIHADVGVPVEIAPAMGVEPYVDMLCGSASGFAEWVDVIALEPDRGQRWGLPAAVNCERCIEVARLVATRGFSVGRARREAQRGLADRRQEALL